MIKKTLALLIIAFLLCSCVVNTNTMLSGTENKSGRFDTSVQASDFFSVLIEDLASFSRSDNTGLIYGAVSDFINIVNGCTASSNVGATKEEGKENYTISFDFSDLNSLVAQLCKHKDQTVLKVSDGRIDFNLDINNYNFLEEMVPFLKIEDIAVYGPAYNQDYSQDDYLTMISFIAGDEAPEGILSSYVRINIKLPSAVKTTNGTVVDKNTVMFEFPLIDFLLLHNPINFYCTY